MKIQYNKLYLLIFVLFLFCLTGCDSKNLSKGKIEKIQKQGYYDFYIDDKELKLEIASDSSSRSKGLSGREELCENCGMLFLFDKKSMYDFWMKDMKFPLDIVYIDGNKVSEVFTNVPMLTDGKTTVISPKNPADKVLELNAFSAEKNGLKQGKILTF